MSNRNILFATALFLVLVLGFIVSSPGGSKTGKIKSDQDFTIVIPPQESNAPHGGSVHEELTAPVVDLSVQEQQQALANIVGQEHNVASSNMSSDGKWFPLDFLGHEVYNPNVLPHPHPLKKSEYIMIAQETMKDEFGFFRELACSAAFANDTMKCQEPPIQLPIASTVSDKCPTKLEPFNYQKGPHDARAFYGPDARPWITYSSPSAHTCMGMWMQDLGRLYPWNYLDDLERTQPFFQPTDLQRPPPYNTLEKNWFPFWDRAGDMYLHYDITPRRVFAKVNATGGIGPDLAPAAYASDEQCIAKYMPKITHPGYEHIHQSTNSVLITLCDRDPEDMNPTCFETEHNTFIMTIFQHKASFQHDVYEPYMMLFKRTAPFELHAISQKPFWINGRGKPSATSKSKDGMFYITSMNWQGFGMGYQGYTNNKLLISFGVGDQRSGAIDVLAADLVKDLNICSP